MAYCAFKPKENLWWDKELSTWVTSDFAKNLTFVSEIAVVRSLHENGEDPDSVRILLINV